MKVADLFTYCDMLVAQGRADEEVVVRGYESGLDPVVRLVDVDVLPDRNPETYYGPHTAARVEGARSPLGTAVRPTEEPNRRVVWLLGSRDLDGDDVYPQGSTW